MIDFLGAGKPSVFLWEERKVAKFVSESRRSGLIMQSGPCMILTKLKVNVFIM